MTERAIFLEIEISKSVDHVGVRRSDQGLGVQPLLEDGQNVVALAKDLLGAFLHAIHVECGKRPEIGLDATLEEEFLLEACRCPPSTDSFQCRADRQVCRSGTGAPKGSVCRQ